LDQSKCCQNDLRSFFPQRVFHSMY
jgi:hypothetical protein